MLHPWLENARCREKVPNFVILSLTKQNKTKQNKTKQKKNKKQMSP